MAYPNNQNLNYVENIDKRIFIASDHAGFNLKSIIKDHLSQLGFEIEDFGPQEYNQSDDYPDFVVPLAQKVASENHKGIVLCANGQGACIAANKIGGVRAATAMTPDMAASTRADDDANILCLPAKYLDESTAKSIIETWLDTPFSGAERHERRIKKVMELDKDDSKGV